MTESNTGTSRGDASAHSTEFLRALEITEAAAWKDCFLAVPEAVAREARVTLEGSDYQVAGVVASCNVLGLNRVVGFGVEAPVGEDELDALIDVYRWTRAPRFFVQVSPLAQPETVTDRLIERGFRHYNNWAKFYRDTAPVEGSRSDLEVRRVGHEHAEDFARSIIDSFDWPQSLIPWMEALVNRRDWTHYMAFDGDNAVATGAFYRHGDFAWLDFASTSPEYRGRGAQSALLARRIEDLKVAGCRWVVTETAEDTAQRDAPSYRNMLRHGFTKAYARPNYILDFAGNR
jgi:GNAT superfamily N-acetyltransferase